MNIKTGLALAYQMGYDDALGRRRPEPSKAEDMADGIARENAMLRELCADMFNCISHANEQDWFYFARDEAGCGMSCTVNGEGCGLSVLANRMRELGVEE